MLKTALIVDDSKLSRVTLKRLLATYDIDVSEAEGVIEAERWIFDNLLPDVVFMDVMMPELDGFEGLARLRAHPQTRKIPVIMYSGDISEATRKKARRLGANGYLPKPVDASGLDRLLSVLHKRLQERQQQKIGQALSGQTQVRAHKPGTAMPEAEQIKRAKAPTQIIADPEVATQAEPELWAQKSDLLRRMDAIEQRLTMENTTASGISINTDMGRKRRDVVRLQRQLSKNEQRIRLSFFVSGLAVALALASLFRSFY